MLTTKQHSHKSLNILFILKLTMLASFILCWDQSLVRAEEASCDVDEAEEPDAYSEFESECRERDYAIVLGNSVLDFKSIVSDSYHNELLIAGTVEHETTTVAYFTLIEYLNCISKFYKRIENITRVEAVLRDRISTNSFYYMVGYDSSDAEFIFRFDYAGGLLAWKFDTSASYTLPLGLSQYDEWIVVTSPAQSKVIDFDDNTNPSSSVKVIDFSDESVLTTLGIDDEVYYVT